MSGPYFPVFGLNTERYSVSLRMQSEYRKIWTRNSSVFGHFSRSDLAKKYILKVVIENLEKKIYSELTTETQR